MNQVTIKDHIKRLVEVQRLDVQIYEYRKDLKEKPALVQQLKEEFEAKKAKLKGLEEKHLKLIVERKGKEVELMAKEGDIVKANAQLFSLKTNKEYQAKMTEIESIKADKSIMEEKILLSYDDIDALNAVIAKEKEIVSAEEKLFFTKKKEADDLVQAITEKLKVLEGERRQLVPSIDQGIYKQYVRILENKEGLALVPVQGQVCGGCYMNIPMQVINVIKMNEHIVNCEMCARLLYIAEDL